MTRKKATLSLETTIETLSAKGNGLGLYKHPCGKDWVVEVPFAIPGDRVLASVYKKKSGVCHGRLEALITPSPLRQIPRCSHFGICGGCRWQQMSYEHQLLTKANYVRACFGGLLTESVSLRSIVPCDDYWQYRNKMEFSFSQDGKGEKFLGLIMDSSRGKVMNNTECHLVRGWFAALLTVMRQWWDSSGLSAYYPPKDLGSLRVLTLREGMKTRDKLVMLTVSGNADFALNKEQLNSFTSCVKNFMERDYPDDPVSIFLRIQQACKGKPTSFYEMHLYGPEYLREELSIQVHPGVPPERLSFHISPSAFFQPNTFQAEKFYSLALQMAEATKNSVVYDLYCGTGTIGLSIAKHVKQVVGIEISPEASLDARANASLNQITNYTIRCGSVGNLPGKESEEGMDMPDIVLVDPPRVGLDAQAINYLLALKAEKIVYISCNPKTQASDIATMVSKGYRLKIVQPVDQFPQTVHIENIALLVRE